jgi:hypothetical protein
VDSFSDQMQQTVPVQTIRPKKVFLVLTNTGMGVCSQENMQKKSVFSKTLDLDCSGFAR